MPLLTRPLLPEDAECVECSTHLETWQGQPGARDYRYDARAIARTLVRISEGATYQDASIEARRRRKGTLRPWEHSGHLAAGWVEVFGPIVAGPDLPDHWPEVVVIDSKKFQTGSGQGAPTWHVLMAAGVDPPREMVSWATPAVPWATLAVPTLNGPQWERFFRNLPGEPRLVVCDRGSEIEGAIRGAWPHARIYFCEHHFFSRHRVLINGLPWRHPLRKTLFKDAFKSVEDWDAFEDVARYEHAVSTDPAKPGGHNLSALMTAFRNQGAGYRDQIVHRQPGDPRSNGAAEAMARALGRAIPRLRANRMTNVFRANNLVMLLLAHQRGEDDELVWAARIRDYLESNGGRAPLHQGVNNDKDDNWTLCLRPKRKKAPKKAKRKAMRKVEPRKRR